VKPLPDDFPVGLCVLLSNKILFIGFVLLDVVLQVDHFILDAFEEKASVGVIGFLPFVDGCILKAVNGRLQLELPFL
jgi:hypothetical protein